MAPGTEGDTGHVGTVPWCVGISSLWPEDPAPLVKDHKEGARCPEMVRTRARPGVLSPASPWLCLCRSTLPYALQIQLIWQVLLCANDMGACPGSRLGHLLPSEIWQGSLRPQGCPVEDQPRSSGRTDTHTGVQAGDTSRKLRGYRCSQTKPWTQICLSLKAGRSQPLCSPLSAAEGSRRQGASCL